MTNKMKLKIILIAIAAASLVCGYLLLKSKESNTSIQSTDDAYVQADFTVVAPQIAGVISKVSVDDNQEVKAGAALINIDERNFRIAVNNAQASIESLKAQLDRQDSVIKQAEATVSTSMANLKLAEANRTRFENLARDGSGTVQARQQAEAEWSVQNAALNRDKAGLQAAQQQVAILKADLDKADAVKAEAELKLSYARITAPVDGVVAQRRARSGSYINAGEALLTLVPLDAVYIEANYRETQMANVKAGQSVAITVDALPGVNLRGVVQSLGPASGVSFSPVPPHNATGNFTKIVQRLPVRIQILPGQADIRRLRVGMSVRPQIDIQSSVVR